MAKPKLLFYLQPNVIELYSNQSDGPARFNLSPEIAQYQEVLDNEKYTHALENFLTQLGVVELETVILISSLLIYSQEFPYEQTTTVTDPNKPLLDYNALNTKIQNFVDLAPFDSNQIAKLELKGEASSLILLTNQALFKPIVEAVIKLGGRVLSVVPVTVFPDLVDQPSLTTEAVNWVFENKKTLQLNNFLLSQAVVNPEVKNTTVMPLAEEEDEGENSHSKSKFLLIFGSLFILAGMAILSIMLGLIKNPLVKAPATKVSNNLITASPLPIPVVTVATEAAVPVSSDSTTLQAIKREGLTVNIINGSGVIGQGLKVKNILTNLGYKNINIAGTVLSGGSDTIISFSTKVSSSNQSEVEQALRQAFLNVKPQQASPSAKYDIEITAGLNK